MKNSQKGFVVPLLITIIALLVIGGGVYVYRNKKVEAPAVIDTETQQTNTQTAPVTSSQTILNSLVTDWKKIGPNILPGFPAISQAFYGYPWIIQFIGNNSIVISYEDDFNPLFAVLSYDSSGQKFSYLDGLRSSPFKVTETLWNTWRNKYGDVSFAPQTYQFYSTRTGDVVYSSDWKLITKNPFTSPSVSTSNSKTYANAKYGFEFQYPSTWKECDANTLQKAIAQNSKNDKYVRTICIYDPSFSLQADTGAVKSVVFYVDESGQHGTFGTLRNTLQADHQRAINLGLYSTFAEKILGGRSFLHAGAGDVDSWGTYYGLLDVKTTQKTYLVVKYTNAITELEKILSSLKSKEDNFNF